MKKFRKVICLALILTMILSMTACFGNRGGGKGSGLVEAARNTANSKEAVFREIGTLRPDCDYVDSVFVNGEDICVTWMEYQYPESSGDNADIDIMPYENEGEDSDVEDSEVEDSDVSQEQSTCRVNIGRTTFGGAGMSVTGFELEPGEMIGRMTVDNNTGNYVVVTYYEEWGEDENGYYSHQFFYMNIYSPDGELLSREELKFGNSDEWYSVGGLVVTPDGNICFALGNQLVFCDSSCKVIGNIKMNNNQWIQGVFLSSSGMAYVNIYTDTTDSYGNAFYPIDMNKMQLGAEVKAPKDYWGDLRTGAGHDLYYHNNKGVFTYDFATEENKLILNFVDSDLDCNYINYCVAVDETRVAAVCYDPENYKTYISFLEKVPPEQVADKEIVVLGMVYLDYEIQKKVVAFNKSSSDCRIRVVEYYQFNNEDDWDAGMKAFTNDIITSNAPDIIVINQNMPINSFMEKGVLMNLNPYIDADAEISKEDLAPNVMALGSKGDNTYILPVSFYISTMAMKQSMVPNGQSITLQELQQLEAKYGNILAFRDCTRMEIISNALQMNSKEFLDVESGKCSFNTQAFYDLLEYAKKYPEEIDWENMDENHWMESETAIRENKALIQYASIYYFNNIGYMEQGTFGEKVVFTGFPGTQGNTGVITPNIQLAISKDCKTPDVAWKFIREFFTYEGQKAMDNGIPTNLKVLDERLALAQERPFWIDENGVKQEYDETYWVGGQEIIIEPLTAERAKEIREYVLSVDSLYYYNQEIIDIILEEAAPFFAGQKTAEQAADIIQSRVQIYVNENQ